MTRAKVLVTRRWPQVVETEIGARFDAVLNEEDVPLSADDFREALQSCDAILPTVTDSLSGAALNVGRARCRIFANFGVGTSHIDVKRAQALGIAVTNTPDVLSACTADIAMMLILMIARRAGEGEREVRARAWRGWRPTHMVGERVWGKTLGIVGFGRIGQALAQRAHHGFGMRIVVCSRSSVAPERLVPFSARQAASLEALMRESDFVSLHCPGGAENRHLINARMIAAMRPGAFLINTSRGEVVDEATLADALAEGRIGGAGLDVFDGEPDIREALFGCERLTMLPHLGSATRETREAMGFRALENLEAFFAGRPPPDLVT